MNSLSPESQVIPYPQLIIGNELVLTYLGLIILQIMTIGYKPTIEVIEFEQKAIIYFSLIKGFIKEFYYEKLLLKDCKLQIYPISDPLNKHSISGLKNERNYGVFII